MNEIIKERLALIQSGTIPHGYKKTKAGIMPEDWDGTVRAKDVFKNHTDKKHNGDFEILAATQENGIVPRSQIGIDIQCSEKGVNGYKKVSKGDFVISLRSFQGGIEYSEYDGIVSPAYTVLQPVREIYDGYYRNYFKTASFIQRLNGAVYGIRDGKQIGYQDFGDMYIHCPPVDEQKKIAEILEQCDKIISLKQERMEEEKQKKKGLLKQLLHSPESKNWKRYHLSDTGTIITGATPASGEKEFYDGGKIPWITPTDIGGKYIADSERKLTEKGFQVARKIPANSLLVTCIASIGKNAILTTEGSCNQQINAVVLHNQFLVEFMYYLMEDNLRYFRKIAGMTATPIVNAKAFGKMKFSIPDIDTQKKIANILSKQDKLMENIAIELEWWKQKKKALMQLLLTGIVRVKP